MVLRKKTMENNKDKLKQKQIVTYLMPYQWQNIFA